MRGGDIVLDTRTWTPRVAIGYDAQHPKWYDATPYRRNVRP